MNVENVIKLCLQMSSMTFLFIVLNYTSEDFKNIRNTKEKHQNDENTNVDQSMISRHLQKGKPNERFVSILLISS